MKKLIKDYQKEERLWKEARLEKSTIFFIFWKKFRTYNFRDVTTGKEYTKGQFWDKFREIALRTLENEIDDLTLPDKFLLIINLNYKIFLDEKRKKDYNPLLN
jgi:hypothetical protein